MVLVWIVHWLVGRVAGRKLLVFVSWGLAFEGVVADALQGVEAMGPDEPESLILAQSERWRHA